VSLPAPGTFAMVLALRPKSVRGKSSASYTRRIQDAARTQSAQILTGVLYVRITWFQLEQSTGDVDNMAKWILDSLKGVVIQDDDDIARCLIQKTVADSTGSFTLNTLGIPSATVLADLRLLLGRADHVLYIEVGPVLDPTVLFGPVS
jgi:hypothetical protein